MRENPNRPVAIWNAGLLAAGALAWNLMLVHAEANMHSPRCSPPVLRRDSQLAVHHSRGGRHQRVRPLHGRAAELQQPAEANQAARQSVQVVQVHAGHRLTRQRRGAPRSGSLAARPLFRTGAGGAGTGAAAGGGQNDHTSDQPRPPSPATEETF